MRYACLLPLLLSLATCRASSAPIAYPLMQAGDSAPLAAAKPADNGGGDAMEPLPVAADHAGPPAVGVASPAIPALNEPAIDPPAVTVAEPGPSTLGPLAPDTLYAVPLAARVTVGQPVRVLVATGTPAHPFQYVNCVGLTVPDDAEYVRLSLDIGAPDGQPDRGGVYPVDGIWAAMRPGQGFLLAPDQFIVNTALDDGRERWDINVTPLGGRDLTAASGELFSVEFTFGTPGVKVFGFQQLEGVKRTYYCDSNVTEAFWGDIANAGGPGLPNAVVAE